MHFRVGNPIQVVSSRYVGAQGGRILVPTRVFEIIVRSGGAIHGDRG